MPARGGASDAVGAELTASGVSSPSARSISGAISPTRTSPSTPSTPIRAPEANSRSSRNSESTSTSAGVTRRAPLSISQGGGDDDAACSPSPEALLAAMAEHEEPRDVFIDAEALADDATTPAEGERPDDDSVLVLNNDQNGLSDATNGEGELDVDADAERALLTASRESSIGRAIDDVLDDELQFSGEDLDDSDEESGDDGDDAPPYAHSEFSPRLADFGDDDDDFLGDEEHDRLDARSEFRSVGVGASVSDVFANDEDDSWLTYDPTSSPPPEHDLNDVPEWGGPTSPIADPNRRARPRRRGANRREEDRAVHASSFDGGVLDEDRGDDPSLRDDRSPDDRSRRHPRRSRRRDRTLRFSGEALAGVQVQVEVANVEVDERACGEDARPVDDRRAQTHKHQEGHAIGGVLAHAFLVDRARVPRGAHPRVAQLRAREEEQAEGRAAGELSLLRGRGQLLALAQGVHGISGQVEQREDDCACCSCATPHLLWAAPRRGGARRVRGLGLSGPKVRRARSLFFLT